MQYVHQSGTRRSSLDSSTRAPTTKADRKCKAHDVCTDFNPAEYEETKPTETTDRVCSGAGTCANGKLVSTAAARTGPNQCQSCDAGYYLTGSLTCQACPAGFHCSDGKTSESTATSVSTKVDARPRRSWARSSGAPPAPVHSSPTFSEGNVAACLTVLVLLSLCHSAAALSSSAPPPVAEKNLAKVAEAATEKAEAGRQLSEASGYTLLESGTCADVGEPMTTKADCETAAAALGLSTGMVTEMTTEPAATSMRMESALTPSSDDWRTSALGRYHRIQFSADDRRAFAAVEQRLTPVVARFFGVGVDLLTDGMERYSGSLGSKFVVRSELQLLNARAWPLEDRVHDKREDGLDRT